ncbi:SDR family NAD(P)-dependent oxidoreductase [Caballeronia sp. S22]|uniref:SDR family NAD(P)-dependent oxidoreductase n=1 Tax=Caballeronia sp. S22 TaxID=3137182 RepID=UPI003530B08F
MNRHTAIITGAAGGIGAALAERLVGKGVNVVLVGHHAEKLTELARRLELDDSNSLVVEADVSRHEDVDNYVRLSVEKFGRIDYFSNNAGIEGKFALIEDLSSADFDEVYQVNVRGVFLGLRAVLPHMKRQHSGSIVVTASLASLWGLPRLGAYISSKHAIVGLTKVAALEAAEHSVRINAVLPGMINTGMMRRIEYASGDAQRSRSDFEAAAPMKRYGEPAEVASVIEFLFSDAASFVTSSLYTVDGGAIWQ